MSQGGIARPDLELRLAPALPEALAGASLPVMLQLRNRSPAGGVLVDSPDSDMPFGFEIREANGTLRRTSRADYLQRTMPEPPPPRQPDLAALPAGGTLDYRTDLARWLLTPLPPGTHEVVATYTLQGATFRSAPARLTIAAPRVELLAAAPNGDQQQLGVAIVHADPAGPRALLQRESGDGFGGQGYFRPRQALARPGSLAISTDAEGATRHRWVVWTEAGNATLAYYWGDARPILQPPVPVGPEARLLSPGWTADDDSVLFLAAAPGAATVVSWAGRGQPVRAQPVAMPGLIPASARAGHYRSSAGRRIALVWAEGTRVLGAGIAPGGQASAPRVLADGAVPVVALDIESVVHDGQPLVMAVLAAPGAAEATLLRIRGAEPPVAMPLPLPWARPGARPAAQWAVLAGAEPAVLVLLEQRQLLAWQGGSWMQLRDPAQPGGAALPRLVRHNGAVALWVDQALGVQQSPLRP